MSAPFIPIQSKSWLNFWCFYQWSQLHCLWRHRGHN